MSKPSASQPGAVYEGLKSIAMRQGLTYAGVFQNDGTMKLEYSDGNRGERYRTKIKKPEILACAKQITEMKTPPAGMNLAGNLFWVNMSVGDVRIEMINKEMGEVAWVFVKVPDSGHGLVTIFQSPDMDGIQKDVAALFKTHPIP